MLINIFVLIIYFLVITFFVQQKSNNQIQPKWWQVSISIVAAETSALTFVSLPGIAFAGNLNFLQLALGYILGRVFIAFILLPKYKKKSNYNSLYFCWSVLWMETKHKNFYQLFFCLQSY